MSKHRSLDDTQVHAVQTGWTDILMICRKCSRKLDGGFGPNGKDTLKSAARAQCRRERVGVVEVACLGVCPKHAVTTMRASRPEELRIVPRGAKEERLLF
jgi:predicted metal-binding protein